MKNPRDQHALEVDMSAAAVARRLESLQSLYELMVELRNCRIVGPIGALPNPPAR